SFFFSSRRRHTRCYRDWSSDVCSSDLGLIADRDEPADANANSECREEILMTQWTRRQFLKGLSLVGSGSLAELAGISLPLGLNRSEERRVGKECRLRRVA